MTVGATGMWQPERQRWTSQFQSQLQFQLKYLLHTATYTPTELKRHFETIKTILSLARQQPTFHDMLLDIIMVLHPWPVRWGHVAEWLHTLEFAVDICIDSNQFHKQTKMQTSFAELLLVTGRFEKALHHGNWALTSAQMHQYALLMAKNGWILYRAYTSQGYADKANEILVLTNEYLPRHIPIAEKIETAVWLALTHARSLHRKGRLLEGYDHLQPIIAQLEVDHQIGEYKAESFAVYAELLWNMNWYEQAAYYMQLAIENYQQLGDSPRASVLQGDLSLIYLAMGHTEQTEINFKSAIAQAEEIGLYYQLTEHIGSLAGLYMTQGKLRLAQTYIKRQIEIAKRTGNQRQWYRAIINRGGTLLLMGEFEHGLKDVERGLSYFQEQNNPEMVMLCYLSIGYAYWGLGYMEDGLTLAEEIHLKATTILIGMPHLNLFAKRCLALFCPQQEAFILLQSALSIAQKYKMRIQQAACLLSMVDVVDDFAEKEMYWIQGCDLLSDLHGVEWLTDHTINTPPFIGMIH